MASAASRILRILRRSEIFCQAPSRALRDLAASGQENGVMAGEYIFLEGEPSDWIYFLESGRVYIVKESSRCRAVLEVISPGQIFGAVGAFNDLPYSASAVAMAPCLLLRFSAQHFHEWSRRDPAVSRGLAAYFARKLWWVQRLAASLNREPAESRLCMALLHFADHGFDYQVRRRDLAEMAGLRVETVIRLTSRLRKAGLIRTVGGRLRAVDRPGLLRHLRRLEGGPGPGRRSRPVPAPPPHP